MTEFYEIRDSLIDDLLAAWPELVAVHKMPPQLIQGDLPYGWVVRDGPLAHAPEEGDSRNHHAYAATFSLGGRFAKQPGQAVDDERLRLVKLLFDVITAENHHAGRGSLEQITAMLEVEGEDPSAQFFEVDLTFRCSFLLVRADAV